MTSLLSGYGAVLLDLDGTVYQGERAVPGAGDVVNAVRERGHTVRYVTNNAARTPEDVASRLRGFGLAATGGDVDTSAGAAARLLAGKLPGGATVLVVGAPALAEEVRAAGLTPVPDASCRPDAVVQGFSEDIGWRDLAEACVAIRDGAMWVACNADATLPTERGPLPGNGSLVAALRTSTGVEPLVAGKPEPPLLRAAAEAAGSGPPLVVGDRLSTDIAGASRVGFDALLVLTGVTDVAGLLAAPPEQRPRYLGEDVGALLGDTGDVEIAAAGGWRVEVRGDEIEIAGEGTQMELARTLCAVWWAEGGGTPSLRATSGTVGRMVSDFRLAAPSR